MHEETAIRPSVGRRDGENIIFRQSWWNQLPLLAVFVGLEALAAYLVIALPDIALIQVGSSDNPMSISWVSIVPLLVLGKVAFRIFNERLVLIPQYLIYVTGRLTWRERSVRVEYRHIQEIETDESILQRIVGVGDLVLKPLAGAPLRIAGLRHPREVKNVLRERIVAETETDRGPVP